MVLFIGSGSGAVKSIFRIGSTSIGLVHIWTDYSNATICSHQDSPRVVLVSGDIERKLRSRGNEERSIVWMHDLNNRGLN